MSRGFEDAGEKANKVLAEAVAKRLEPMYCTKCGSRLQVRNVQHKDFDKDTGYPKYVITLGCPHAIVYKTDISKEMRFAWKNPFNRHTVHTISKVIELNSGIADVYCKQCDVYIETDDYNGAIADYSKAIESNPGDVKAYYNRGIAYYKKGDAAKAVSDLEKCIALSTDRELIEAAQQLMYEIKRPFGEVETMKRRGMSAQGWVWLVCTIVAVSYFIWFYIDTEATLFLWLAIAILPVGLLMVWLARKSGS